jgi:hypothetical protein
MLTGKSAGHISLKTFSYKTPCDHLYNTTSITTASSISNEGTSALLPTLQGERAVRGTRAISNEKMFGERCCLKAVLLVVEGCRKKRTAKNTKTREKKRIGLFLFALFAHFAVE